MQVEFDRIALVNVDASKQGSIGKGCKKIESLLVQASSKQAASVMNCLSRPRSNMVEAQKLETE